MRPLEVALIASVSLACVRGWTPLRGSLLATALLGILPTGVALVQLSVEGARWQLTPLWLACALMLPIAMRDLLRQRQGRGELARPTFAIPMLLLVMVGASLAWALPVLELPGPSGRWGVGTATTVFVDPDRDERYGPAPGGPRVLPVQIWYPTDQDTDSTANPWLLDRDRVVEEAADEFGLPGFALDHLTTATSHAARDARPLETGAPLPIVLYSHGWSGFREIHSTQLESLASHGYLVISADHTYSALATELPGGLVAGRDSAVLPTGVSREVYDEASALLVETVALDLEALLTHLLDGELLAGRIDLERIDAEQVAMIGHSTGGGAAVLACSRDERCDAVVGYDPWVEPVPDEVIGGDLRLPLLSLRSEEWVGNANDARLRRLHAGSTGPEGRVAVAGTLHRDLTVLPLLSPLARPLGMSGPSAGEQTLSSLDRWTLRFLNHHVRGRGLDPLTTPPRDEQTTLENGK